MIHCPSVSEMSWPPRREDSRALKAAPPEHGAFERFLHEQGLVVEPELERLGPVLAQVRGSVDERTDGEGVCGTKRGIKQNHDAERGRRTREELRRPDENERQAHDEINGGASAVTHEE